MAVVNDEEGELMDSLPTMGKQSVVDVHLCEQLTPEQNVQFNVLLQEFSEIFSDLPGCTPLISHEIKLTGEASADEALSCAIRKTSGNGSGGKQDDQFRYN